jgi:hypothetical protein
MRRIMARVTMASASVMGVFPRLADTAHHYGKMPATVRYEIVRTIDPVLRAVG